MMPPSVYKSHIYPTIDLFGALNAFLFSSWWYAPTIPRWPPNGFRSSGYAGNASRGGASGVPWCPSYGIPSGYAWSSRVGLPRFLSQSYTHSTP